MATKNGAKKSVKSIVVCGFKVSNISQAMNALFSRKMETATVEEATKIARKLRPSTKFNQWHFYFHRTVTRKLIAAGSK